MCRLSLKRKILPNSNCVGRGKVCIDDAIKLAKGRNGECLSAEIKTTKSKLEWKCCLGHIWRASFNNIKYNKSWCPKCKKLNGKQNKLFKIIKNIFPGMKVEQNFRGFDWLKTHNTGKQEIDIFVCAKDKRFSLAIEYQGEQHFKPVRFGGIPEERAKQNLKYVKKLDKIKRQKILNNKKDVMYFVEFSYIDNIDIGTVLERLEDNGINCYRRP